MNWMDGMLVCVLSIHFCPERRGGANRMCQSYMRWLAARSSTSRTEGKNSSSSLSFILGYGPFSVLFHSKMHTTHRHRWRSNQIRQTKTRLFYWSDSYSFVLLCPLIVRVSVRHGQHVKVKSNKITNETQYFISAMFSHWDILSLIPFFFLS